MRNKKRNLLSRFSLVGVGGVIILGAILKNNAKKSDKKKLSKPFVIILVDLTISRCFM